jgi:hypothetical protein
MQDQRKYLEELGTAIESCNFQATKHYLQKVKKAGLNIFRERFKNGYTIVGATLRSYLKSKDRLILDQILQVTHPSHWLDVCNPEGQYPFDVAIVSNDLELYQIIDNKSGGYPEHEDSSEISGICGHRSSIEHLMSDAVNLQTFSELIDTVLVEYEIQHSRFEDGNYGITTPLLCLLLRQTDAENYNELSGLRIEKCTLLIEVTTNQGIDMEILLHPSKFDCSSPDEDAMSAAIILGEIKIAEKILQYFFDNCRGDRRDKQLRVLKEYIALTLSEAQRNLKQMFDLLMSYHPKISPTFFVKMMGDNLSEKEGAFSREKKEVQDDILSNLLIHCYKDPINSTDDFKAALESCQALELDLNGVQISVRGTPLVMLTAYGLRKTFEKLLDLSSNKKPFGCEKVNLSTNIPVKLQNGTKFHISLITLALCTNNYKMMKSIVLKKMNPGNITKIIEGLGEIAVSKEIKDFISIFRELLLISKERNPNVDSILSYVFGEEGCISELDLSKLCAQDGISEYAPYFSTYPRGYLKLFNYIRDVVLKNPRIKKVDKAIFVSLLKSYDNAELSWRANKMMRSHVIACRNLGLMPPQYSQLFDVLTALFAVTENSDSRTVTISAILAQYALCLLVAFDDYFSSEERVDKFLKNLDLVLSSKFLLNNAITQLVNRIRVALKRNPYPLDKALCVSNVNTEVDLNSKEYHRLLHDGEVEEDCAIRDQEPSSPNKFCFIEGQFIQLPIDEKEDLNRLILRLITTLTYHATNTNSRDLDELSKKHYKCLVILKLLPMLDQKFSDFVTIQDYRKEQNNLEANVVQDYVGDDISEDSDDGLDANELNVFERRHYDDVLVESQSQQFFDNDGKLKTIIKMGTDGFPKQNKNGGVAYDKRKLKHEPHKRARQNGETALDTYPPEKFKKVRGITLDSSDEIQRYVQNEIQRINAQYHKNPGAYYSNVKTPFFLHFTRGLHYDCSKWNADQRREHRKLNEDETKPSHYASAVFQEKGLDCSSGALIEMNDPIQPELDVIATSIATGLQSLRMNREDGLYHEVHALYSSNYDGFKSFLEKCNSNVHEGNFEVQEIKEAINQYFINQGNHYVSTAGTPYHALKYAYGLKTYPGHQEERLRPRWRRDGRAERPVSGKAYIYLLTLEQYAKSNPYDIPCEYDLGNSGLIGVYRAERETSFFGKIPEGCIFMQHIAKYPSFDKPYKPVYLSKYGLTSDMYEIFGTAIKNSAPHSPENQNAKTILGEWLCAFHEVRILKELTARVVSMGGVILYHNSNGFSEHLPPVVDANDEQKTMIRRGNTDKNRVEKLKRVMHSIMNEKSERSGNTKKRKVDDQGDERVKLNNA